MTGTPVTTTPTKSFDLSRVGIRRSEAFLNTLDPFDQFVLVSHLNPDPDALGSMLGVEALLRFARPGKPVTLTIEGALARAENQAMVQLLGIDLVPVDEVRFTDRTGVVMVDSQPRSPTRARGQRPPVPVAVLDHHETPGACRGVQFRDIRPRLGATCTLVTGYLLEQGVVPDPRLATALHYGIESEIAGYPREASTADDGALVWLFPRTDKDLSAKIRNPRLPHSYFATIQHALGNAFQYRDAIVTWCGEVSHADIVAEVADFFIRFEEVSWVLAAGIQQNALKFSLRSDHIGGHCGEILREVLNGLGSGGGHDKRAGGLILLEDTSTENVDCLLKELRHRFLERLGIQEQQGSRLLDSCPMIAAP